MMHVLFLKQVISGLGLSRDNTSYTAGDKRGYIRENPRKGNTSRRNQIFGIPFRAELILILPQSLKIIKMFPLPEYK